MVEVLQNYIQQQHHVLSYLVEFKAGAGINKRESRVEDEQAPGKPSAVTRELCFPVFKDLATLSATKRSCRSLAYKWRGLWQSREEGAGRGLCTPRAEAAARALLISQE